MPVVKMGSNTSQALPGKMGGVLIWLSSPVYIFVSFFCREEGKEKAKPVATEKLFQFFLKTTGFRTTLPAQHQTANKLFDMTF